MTMNFLPLFLLVCTQAFTILPLGNTGVVVGSAGRFSRLLFSSSQDQQEVVIELTPDLSDDFKVTQLFAWISRAFAGDARYGNRMVAFAAIFGNLPENHVLIRLLDDAVALLPDNTEQPTGAPYSLLERQEASLGAMGAGQWTGQWKTRPHALLSVENFAFVDDWVATLPRGCKRTLKKALAQNFTVTAKPIPNDAPAPHSSLAHFRCVVEHEVRLLSSAANYGEGFFHALNEAVGRYVGTTRMAGEITEYRNSNGTIIAFAHQVRKGNTIRGQWFYASDEAAKLYVWFHSVYSLVEQAIEAEGVSVVDLGPSGSDDFSYLKERYGFVSVDDWPAVANYRGPFWCYVANREEVNGLTI